MATKDLTNQRFGLWTVLGFSERKREGAYWVCKCDCGTIAKVHGGNLAAGRSTNCGCQRKRNAIEKSTKHNGCKTRLYTIYCNIKARCYNEKNPAYYCYGGRGITLCEEWRNLFSAFRDWALSNGYTDDLTIDRIDVNGNYCPENCRWATYKEQGNNTRKNLKVEISGQEKTLAQWCDGSEIKYATAYYRLTHGVKAENIFDKNYYTNQKSGVV